MFLQKKLINSAFLWATILLPLGVVAQKRNLVSFSGGYSLPVGKFASENFNDPKAGIAGPGFFGQLSFERKFAEWIGLRTTGSLNINQTNAQPLIQQYSGFLAKPETYAWQQDVTKWRFGALLLGPAGYLGSGDIELEGHVQGGLVFAESPGVTLNGTSSVGSPAIEGRVSKAAAITYGLGAGVSLRLRLTDLLRLQITADAIGANVELKDIPTYVKVANLPPLESSQSRKRIVSVVNVGAGLVLGF